MRKSVTGLLIALCAVPCTAAVYRWVDAQGQVHYAQAPPKHGDYRRVATPGREPVPAPGLEAIEQFNAAAEARRDAERAARDEQARQQAQREQACEAARQRLAYLDQHTAHRLLRVTEGGETVRYTEQMFRAERDKAQAQMAEHCGPAPAR